MPFKGQVPSKPVHAVIVWNKSQARWMPPLQFWESQISKQGTQLPNTISILILKRKCNASGPKSIVALGTVRNCVCDHKFSSGDSAVLHPMRVLFPTWRWGSVQETFIFPFRNSSKHDAWIETLILRKSSFFADLQELFGQCVLWSFIFDGHNTCIVQLSLNRAQHPTFESPLETSTNNLYANLLSQRRLRCKLFCCGFSF